MRGCKVSGKNASIELDARIKSISTMFLKLCRIVIFIVPINKELHVAKKKTAQQHKKKSCSRIKIWTQKSRTEIRRRAKENKNNNEAMANKEMFISFEIETIERKMQKYALGRGGWAESRWSQKVYGIHGNMRRKQKICRSGCGTGDAGMEIFELHKKTMPKKNQYKSLISNRSFAEPNTKKKRK